MFRFRFVFFFFDPWKWNDTFVVVVVAVVSSNNTWLGCIIRCLLWDSHPLTFFTKLYEVDKVNKPKKGRARTGGDVEGLAHILSLGHAPQNPKISFSGILQKFCSFFILYAEPTRRRCVVFWLVIFFFLFFVFADRRGTLWEEIEPWGEKLQCVELAVRCQWSVAVAVVKPCCVG